MASRVPVQPGLHPGMLVGGVVVEDEVQVEFRVALSLDGAQEAEEPPGDGDESDTGE